MLGKLIKYEWKSTYKVGGIFIICLAVITFIGCLSLRMPFLYDTMSGEYGVSFSMLDMLGIMTLGIYIFSLVGIVYAVMIYLGIRFYKSMYTDEGYLTHTLPVTTVQLLTGKLLVSAIWQMIAIAAIFLSLVLTGYTAVCIYAPTTPAELTRVLAEAFATFFEELPAEVTGGAVHLIVSLVLAVLISPFGSMMMLFGAITLGQLFTKHRGMMAIVCYIGINMVYGIVSSLVSFPLSLKMMFAGGLPAGTLEQGNFLLNYYASLYDMSVIMNLIAGGVLFAVSYLILTKKFDIE